MSEDIIEYARNWLHTRSVAASIPVPATVRSAQRAARMLADPTRSVPDVAAVPSQATVSGLQALTQASAGDAALKGARNVFEITSAMVQYPIVGATTVMDLAIGYTGFDPTNWEKEGNYEAFLKYVQALLRRFLERMQENQQERVCT